MIRLRHHPPARPPVRIAEAGLGALRTLVRGTDERPGLMKLLSEEYHCHAGVLCGSGGQALKLAIELGCRMGTGERRIALPAFTCFDVAAAAIAADAEVLLYDIDPHTLSPDLGSLDAALGRGANVVVVTPLYGIPVDWAGIKETAAPYGATVIEDAAQGLGATWSGTPLGALGDISVLSFGRGKGWSGGRGGALLVRGEAVDFFSSVETPNDPSIFREWEMGIRSVGTALFGSPWLYGVPSSVPWFELGRSVFHKTGPVEGLTRCAAEILDRTYEESVRRAWIRREIAQQWIERIGSASWLRFMRKIPGAEPTYLRFPLRLTHGLSGFSDADEAMRLGITPSYPNTLAGIPELQPHLVPHPLHFPGADTLVRELVTLPTHGQLSVAEQDRVVEMIRLYRASEAIFDLLSGEASSTPDVTAKFDWKDL